MLLTNSQLKLAIAIVLLMNCALANAVTIKVNNRCTLADALYASNNDVKRGGCPAGSGIDTIVLPANGNYLIPVLDKSNNDRFYHLDSPSVSSTVIIEG